MKGVRVFILLFLCLLFVSETIFSKVLGSRYGIYKDKIRIVLDLDRKRDFKVFTLNNPKRIVIDIYNEWKVNKLKLPEGFRYRVGKHRWGTRIVLIYERNFSLKYFSLRKPFRIVLDIYKEKENELYTEVVKIISKNKKSSDPIGELIREIYSKPIVFEKKVIVIDAGHGGKDPGAIGYGGIKEKDINLAIARRVAEYLKKDGRFKVVLTRKGDYFVPLHKRALIALKNRADLFISIHSDAAPKKNPRARGTQVFALSPLKAYEKKLKILKNDRYARLVLGEEGTRSLVVRRVLADLALDVTLQESVIFGRILAEELKRTLGKRVKFKGINRAGFAVLKTPGIPSVLIETGFITNPQEAKMLKDPEFQKKIAWAIYRAIVRYFYGEDFGNKLVKY